MATDLAEFLGAAIGISLLFGVGLLPSVLVTGVVTYVLLLFQRHGFRPIELIVGAFVAVIALAYVIELADRADGLGRVRLPFRRAASWRGRRAWRSPSASSARP